MCLQNIRLRLIDEDKDEDDDDDEEGEEGEEEEEGEGEIETREENKRNSIEGKRKKEQFDRGHKLRERIVRIHHLVVIFYSAR